MEPLLDRPLWHKKAVRISILIFVVVCLLLIVIVRAVFISFYMPDSMQPLAEHQNVVIAAKWFRTASLRSGDLVLVNIPTPAGRVLTVRQIEQQPDTPPGQFYLHAWNTNGFDSRQFGALPARDIRGKVIWTVKAN